jgi:uncharacterized membrane protein
MNHWWFFFRLRQKDVLRAIQAAESRTSGEIRVFVSHHKVADVQATAREQFEKLGMTATRERNGVLIFVAPRSRVFAILGDAAIHAECGDGFWSELATTMSAAFKQGQLTEGLVQTITRAGDLLAEHFPRGEDDRNELPDAIAS